jgi:predicted nuclease of restriction endonuclease-like (RecB) superfamily
VKQELAVLRSRGGVTPAMLLKDPYILDFLGLADRFLERDLGDAILRELETFLLEMGSGFSFVARQKRIFSSTGTTSTLIFFSTTAS